MNRKQIAVISLGDGRRNFYNSRKDIADSEKEKLIAGLSQYYDVYAPDVVFTIDEALSVSDEIKRRIISQVIIHIPIWCTPNLVLRIANSTPYPVILFGNTRKDSSSMVAIFACAGILRQIGKEHRRVVGEISNPDVFREVQIQLKAIEVAEKLKRSSFGMIGGRSIGIGTTVADPMQWQKIFGVEFDHCDQYEIVYRAKEMDAGRVKKHMNWVKEHFTIFYNPTFDEKRLELQIRSYLALKDMAAEHCYTFMGVKCQPDMSDHFVLQCLGVSLLNNNYDADGDKTPIPTSCECDCDGALTMQVLSLCAGGLPSCLVDIKFFDKGKKEFILANCGAMAPYFADTKKPDMAMKKTYLMHHVFGEAGGASVQMVGSTGDITCARLIRNNGEYALVCFEGKMEEREREELRKTNYSYPTQFILADIDYDSFFKTMDSNHFHTVYGKYAEVLREFCKIEGIKFICYNEDECSYASCC